MGKGYHKYVFDLANRQFIGEFDNMYKAEKIEGFDSWEQNNVSYLDKQLCIQIVNSQQFETIIDVGCGKGALTSLMKTKGNRVIGIDISPEAISIAKERHDNINFLSADINQISLGDILENWIGEKRGGGVNCIICLETLSYLSNWKKVLKDFATIGEHALIKIFFPENPIGFVKTNNDLYTVFSKYFDIIEHIELVNRQMTVLFGKSKNLGGIDAWI